MESKSVAQFIALRPPVKAMIYLFWIYVFAASFTGFFVQLFVYGKFHSIATNVIAMGVNFTGLMIGFCVVGWLYARLRINIKLGYVGSFILMATGFLFLYGDVSYRDAMLFMFVNGMGNGIYWLTIYTFELTETKNNEREFYSSMLSFGGLVVGLIAPLLGTLLLYLSEFIFHQTFTLLFLVAPIFYLFGLPFIANISDYRPHPIRMRDVRHFFTDRRNQFLQVYMAGDSLSFACEASLIPVASLLLLKDAKNVGIYNSIFAVISALMLVFLTRFRNEGNRLSFLALTTLLLSFFAILPAVSFTLIVFVIFTLGSVIVKPLYRVSSHVIDLETMETLAHADSDFYPTMILRDLSLWVWRMVGCSLLLIVTMYVHGDIETIRLGFLLMVAAPMLTLLGAFLLYRTSHARSK